MRILIFHGYLLNGTGSNVYNARLAEALVGLGHEVHLLCQERHPERCAFVSAAGDWDSGALHVRALSTGEGALEQGQGALGPDRGGSGLGSCTIYRPDIGGLLPLYVQDSYEGIEARTFAACSDEEIAAYVQANVAAVSDVVARTNPDLALANHLVMGPAILARALRGEVPYAVKVHGSALEYTVKPEPERFLGYAREGVAGARTVLVGSTHTAQSLWRALEEPALPSRTRLGPPGVDVQLFAPRASAQARAGLDSVVERLGSGEHGQADGEGAFARDEREVAVALECVAAGEGELVAFVGKLIAAKGIDLVLAAWPLVLERRPRARLLVIGFGSERERLQEACAALARGELERVQASALPYVAAFLGDLDADDRGRYAAAAAAMDDQVVFTGRLDHDELADVLPACEAMVVPSTFPEAFGMVAAEAAACGVLPLSAAHSGLAEVSEKLAESVPPQARGLLSFPLGEGSVVAIAERLIAWLELPAPVRERTREALAAVVREQWSWQGVARGVISAALGEPEGPLARAVG